MPRLHPKNIDELAPEFAAALERGLASGVLSTTLPFQVWAHRPEVAEAWLNVLQVAHDTALLSARERELARLEIASINDCRTCQLARKTDALSEQDIACMVAGEGDFSERESLAIEFARRLAIDHSSLDEAFYGQLLAQFSEAEVAELHLYCGLMLAGGRLTYALQAHPERP